MYLLPAVRHNLRRGGNEQGQGWVRLGKGGGGGGAYMHVRVRYSHTRSHNVGCVHLSLEAVRQ